jgi:glutathione S-transferase
VSPVAFALTAPVFGWDTFSKERYQLARVDLDKLLRIIDDHLKINSFLVGNQVTIADILLVGTLHSIFRFILEENSRKTY